MIVTDKTALSAECRSSGQALSTVIASDASDSKTETIHEAHLWLTAGRGMIDSVFDMLPKVSDADIMFTNSLKCFCNAILPAAFSLA